MKKFYLSLTFILLSLILIFHFFYTGKKQILFLSTPVQTAEINNPDDLITLLDSATSYDERKHILELNRDRIKPESVIKIMVKSVYTPSAAKMKNLAQIAVEVGEFTGDME
ncbi:MAG: hypothetical protein ABRQ39_25270 [Candidatus Eremiobacterota bacterium]